MHDGADAHQRRSQRVVGVVTLTRTPAISHSTRVAVKRLEASRSSCRISGKARKRQPPYGLGRGNLAVAREDLIKHLFEVVPIAMSLDELRSNNWRHISQHVAAKRIKSPKLPCSVSPKSK